MFLKVVNSVKIVWQHARILTIVKILQSLMVAVLTPLNIYATQQLIDSVIDLINNGNNVYSVCVNIIVVLGCHMFLAANSFFENILQLKLEKQMENNMATEILKKLSLIDFYCFEDKDSLNTILRMGKRPHEKIINVFLATVSTSSLLVTVVGTALVFKKLSIYISLSFLVMLLPMIWLDFKAMRLMDSLFNSQSEEEKKLNYYSKLLDTKNTLLELKLFQATEFILEKWSRTNNKVQDERVKTTIQSHKYYAISSLLLISWIILVVVELVCKIRIKAISVGIFIALMNSANTVLLISHSLSDQVSKLSRFIFEAKHYFDFLELPERKDGSTTLQDNPDYNIRFENVSFHYPGQEIEILKNFSMQINSRQKIALVGMNGAGKSTIVKLLSKLYRPTEGQITVNGIDIFEIENESLKKVYSVVFQDYAKYYFTLREAISLGNLAKCNDIAAIQIAIQQGLASDIVALLKDGLDGSLGNLESDSVDLSGGQWQRIALARACLADSAFVILDEPTAALDPIAEAEMYHSFSTVLQEKGCIMISHRLASAKLADMIYVLHNGKIIENGSHEELMKKNGIYKQMYVLQSSWYDKEVID